MSKKIWVVLQQREGQLHRMSKEAIACGQRLAAEVGGAVSAVLLTDDAEQAQGAAGFDLEALYVAADPTLGTYTPGAFIGALAPALAREQPDFVIFPHTYQSVDYVPRLAHEAGAVLVPEVLSFESADGGLIWRRPILAGKMQARVRANTDGMVMLTVQSGAFPADSAAAGSAEVRPLETAELAADREILRVEQAGEDEVDLTKADVIVAVGRGIGGPEKLPPIEELAKALGADVAASRPVIDNGWLPRDRQIGSSGQTVAPKLYLALGISGAIQHQVGMKGSNCVVAINKDASAPIFNIAQYGVVGDLHELVPAMQEVLAEGD